MTKKLFAVYLGGKADRCNIELHDVVFVVGSTFEETYPMLAKKWFGNIHQFHIDSYIHLQFVDGYEIELVKDASEVDPLKKLYFILIKGAQLKIYKDAPHGMCSTHKNQVNEDLLAFIKG